MGICGFLKKPYLEYVDFGFAFLEKYHCLVAESRPDAVGTGGRNPIGVATFCFGQTDKTGIAQSPRHASGRSTVAPCVSAPSNTDSRYSLSCESVPRSGR